MTEKRLRLAVLVITLVILLSALAGRAVAASPLNSPAIEEVDFLEILQNVILLLIQVTIPPLLALGIAEIKRYIDQVKADSKYRMIFYAVDNAVAAAEQLGLTGQLAAYGENKLQVAIRLVEEQLAIAGVPLDVQQYADAIRAMIEAEVQRQFPKLDPEEQRVWLDEDGDGGQVIIGGETV